MPLKWHFQSIKTDLWLGRATFRIRLAFVFALSVNAAAYIVAIIFSKCVSPVLHLV